LPLNEKRFGQFVRNTQTSIGEKQTKKEETRLNQVFWLVKIKFKQKYK
jgi:hypothetical protein